LVAIGKLGAASKPLQPHMSKLWLAERQALSQAIEASFVALQEHGVDELTRCIGVFGVQIPACDTLRAIGKPAKAAVPALCKLLQSKTHGRNFAAGPLGTIQDPAAIPVLVEVLQEATKGPTTFLWTNVAQAAGRFGPAAAAAAPPLLELMQLSQERREHDDAGRAAMALGDLGVRSPAVLDALRRLATSGEADSRRFAAASLELLELPPTSSDSAIGQAICHASSELQQLGLQRAIERGAAGSKLVKAVLWRLEHTDDDELRLGAIRCRWSACSPPLATSASRPAWGPSR
jgi:HEAT repeat protein